MDIINNKKIAICGDFFKKPVTGVQRFGRELTKALDGFPEAINYEIVVKDKSAVDFDYHNIDIVEYKGHHKGLLWTYLDFPRYVRKKDYIAINLCNRAVPFAKSVTCLHDITYRVNPKLHTGFKNLLRIIWNCWNYSYITNHSQMIFTVSNFSASEINLYYPKARNKKTVVINSAWEHMNAIAENQDFQLEYGIRADDEYFFSLSSIAKNKNFMWILQQAKLHPNDKFIIAGGGSLALYDDIPDNVIFTGYISDESIKSLMGHCKAFLFPTLYEGFGLPPLEAVASGAPKIVLSDTQCMHEIYGECAVYINPEDYCSVVDFRTNSRKDPKTLLEKYSWQRTANIFADSLEKYLH